MIQMERTSQLCCLREGPHGGLMRSIGIAAPYIVYPCSLRVRDTDYMLIVASQETDRTTNNTTNINNKILCGALGKPVGCR